MKADRFESDILRAARLLQTARHAVVFSGAGISTHSGIPDFRSRSTGLWEQDDPMEVSSLRVFRHNPQQFFNWLRPLAARMWSAQPNPAHLALARLEEMGLLKAVITQNIDGLHQGAGSKRVLQVHGSLETFTCTACGKVHPRVEVASTFLEQSAIPRCAGCQAVLKPDIVLFEEMLPQHTWRAAEEHCQRADLMWVIGSSLQVFPAAQLPALAVESGARLVILNFTPTALDDQADIILQVDLVDAISSMMRLIDG